MREPNYNILAKLTAPLKSPKIKSIAGETFDRWTVYGLMGYSQSKKDFWLCRCSCGNWGIILRRALLNRKSKSCGCLRLGGNHRSHEMSNTPVYRRFSDMHTRCYNENCRRFKDYGGRGIIIEDRWHTFENFYADMGEPPTPQYTIERVNNNGNYGPDNCIWDTRINQARNTRTNVNVTLNSETHCLSEWAEILGIPAELIYQRRKKGITDVRQLLAAP